ncbi:MAG TPA: arabinan endo-1,5-alpha-L-arabinosidase [Longimicrobiaceae bacterium]|nr:arabinan endo-1,5-alpha-L-arabinosidase [Longimicrobiaceae bacterium]
MDFLPSRSPRFVRLRRCAAPSVLLATGMLLGASCGSGTEPSAAGECDRAIVPYPDAPTQTGDVADVHDPAIAREGGSYYVYSTNDGIPIRRSADLVHWERLGRVFADQLPGWAREAVPGVQAPWAPDLSFFDGRYHLYYALSTFGSPRSVIGLATNATLDPAAADYDWKDGGEVVASQAGSPYNAIDPNVAFDTDGQPWLAWGSFGGGIMMRRLDASTGKLSTTDTRLHVLAARPVEQAIEGAFIIRHGGAYWLFASFDFCCRGASSTYNVRVGRAEQITGPYVDRDGVPMTQGGGTRVLVGYGRIRGPGHNAVLVDGDREWFVHHYYDARENGRPKLQVRPLLWADDGWPLVGWPYDGSAAGPASGTVAVAGQWGYWAGSEPARSVELVAGGQAKRCDAGGTWSFQAPSLTLHWTGAAGAQTVSGVVSADGQHFVGRDDSGRVVRAYRISGS